MKILGWLISLLFIGLLFFVLGERTTDILLGIFLAYMVTKPLFDAAHIIITNNQTAPK